MSEAIATLGIRVTAHVATRAMMARSWHARQLSPVPASKAIMKRTRMSLNVRQTRGL